MKDLSQVTASLESKIEKLVHLHRKTVDDGLKLSADNKILTQQVEKLKTQLKDTEEKNKILKLAKTLKETNENTTDVKNKISELVREMDKCMALMNK